MASGDTIRKQYKHDMGRPKWSREIRNKKKETWRGTNTKEEKETHTRTHKYTHTDRVTERGGEAERQREKSSTTRL